MPNPAPFPPVVPIRPHRRVEPGLVVAVTLAALVATAIWKPWTGSAAPPGVLPQARVAAAVQVPPPASSVPVTSAGPGPRVVIALQPAGPIPPLDGLDLRAMSPSDPHAAWGVAVAYTPTLAIESAVWGGISTVTPVVDWEAIAPRSVGQPVTTAILRRGSAGPTLDHPGSTTIAVAVTWPSDIAPRGVSLRWLWPARTQVPAASIVDGGPIPLREPLPLLVRLAPSRVGGGGHTATFRWQRRSGTFFLAPGDPPSTVAGWLAHSWVPGQYAFVVTLADGTSRSLRFVIGG
ncbi:MAG: hypothetical protein IVW53_14545 [Chloroflexi bacterium]|nr:hypothetical protein [Chloroflexota bacterium]MBF6606784.1 hypothetical protein [Chloroflexota bacterium]